MEDIHKKLSRKKESGLEGPGFQCVIKLKEVVDEIAAGVQDLQ